MLAGLFSYPKRHFYLSENNRHYIPISRKFELKKTPVFPAHCNPKIVGNNRLSEQIFIETVCWVLLSSGLRDELTRSTNNNRKVAAGAHFYSNNMTRIVCFWQIRYPAEHNEKRTTLFNNPKLLINKSVKLISNDGQFLYQQRIKMCQVFLFHREKIFF